MLLTGLHTSTLKILQRVKNYAARIVTRLGRSEHITPVLHDLNWLLVDMRILYTVLLYTSLMRSSVYLGQYGIVYTKEIIKI